MKPVVCGCGVRTVPVAGAVSGVTGAVLKTPTRGLPVVNPSDGRLWSVVNTFIGLSERTSHTATISVHALQQVLH
jgi:hypothetical protein